MYEPGEDDPVSPPDDAPPLNDPDDPIPPEPGEDETVIVDPIPPVIDISTAEEPRPKYYIHGKEVAILAERIEYLDENGKEVAILAERIEYLDENGKLAPKACATTRKKR